MDVRLIGISKHFGSVAAVDHLTLEVRSGEFLALVGASGSGKTTLLRIVAGLERQDSGHIYIGDTLVNEVPVGKRNVQMIFQNYALWPHMKVFDEKQHTNVSFPLKMRHWTAEAIGPWAREIARRARLDEVLFDRRPDELSSGQRQRVAIARALTTSPTVFLMDEPLANLDPPTRVKVRGELKRVHQEAGATTIFVTHVMADAFALGDRIAFLRDGRLVQVGTGDEIRNTPADDYVRDFLVS
ncbi:MAG: ABC transporter ATP-binding protein [Chloroflexota bacterium]